MCIQYYTGERLILFYLYLGGGSRPHCRLMVIKRTVDDSLVMYQCVRVGSIMVSWYISRGLKWLLWRWCWGHKFNVEIVTAKIERKLRSYVLVVSFLCETLKAHGGHAFFTSQNDQSILQIYHDWVEDT